MQVCEISVIYSGKAANRILEPKPRSEDLKHIWKLTNGRTGVETKHNNAVFTELTAREGEFVTSVIAGKTLPLLKVVHVGMSRLK